jgi:flagellar biogenesis protein FliO
MNTRGRDGWLWNVWAHVRQKEQRRMRVVENLSLGGKRSLLLVECEGRSFFVGCGADAVNCILPLTSRSSDPPSTHPWKAADGMSE